MTAAACPRCGSTDPAVRLMVKVDTNLSVLCGEEFHDRPHTGAGMSVDGPLIKWLNTDGTPCNGGSGQWFLPSGKRPGKWMPPVTPVPCISGYHVGTIDHALEWIGPAAWLVEVKGEVIDHRDKLVAEQARLVRRLDWDDRTARLFAADCAERVLPIYEKAYPGDDRPRNAIVAARAYANGEIDAAARDAAWDAAWAAARYAAWDARAAARAAARDVARDVERKWQVNHLATILGLETDS